MKIVRISITLLLAAASGAFAADFPQTAAISRPAAAITGLSLSTTPASGTALLPEYRPFIAGTDKIQAVMFVPPEHPGGTSRDAVDADLVNAAVITAYHLSRMKIKVLWINDSAKSPALDRLQTMGADMDFIEHIHTPRPYKDPWIRDYGPFPLMNLATGKWEAVEFDRERSDRADESWLSKLVYDDYGIRNMGAFKVSATSDSAGNVMVDGRGRCFSAGKAHPLLGTVLRCSEIITFPCRSEVCHADEYLTFLKNESVAVNKAEFVPLLRKAGYKNILLLPDNPEISFANVLIVNNTVFMLYVPHLKTEMEKARLIYESQGYAVIAIKSKTASSENGALHCLTKELPAPVSVLHAAPE